MFGLYGPILQTGGAGHDAQSEGAPDATTARAGIPKRVQKSGSSCAAVNTVRAIWGAVAAKVRPTTALQVGFRCVKPVAEPRNKRQGGPIKN